MKKLLCALPVLLLALLWPFACKNTSTDIDIQIPGVDYSEPAPEAATEPISIMAAAGRQPPPFVIPRPTNVVTTVDKDALYLRGSTQDTVTSDTLFEVAGLGRACIITDMPPASHQNWRIQKCVLKGARMWGARWYRNWTATLAADEWSGFEDVFIDDIEMEHGAYGHPGKGRFVVRRVRIRDCGAQALQLRLTAKPTSSDPDWNVAREIVLDDLQALECGQLRGAGRAGFSVSIKAMGPQTHITLRNVFIQTVNQQGVKVYNGKTYDSFGALCVEHCGTLTIEGGYIDMRNPDRKAIQLFDHAWKGKEGGAPGDVFIDSLELGNEDIIVRADDTNRISITNPKGSGRLWLQRWVNGAWKTDSTPIDWLGGYQQ